MEIVSPATCCLCANSVAARTMKEIIPALLTHDSYHHTISVFRARHQHQLHGTGSMETSSSQIPDPGGRFWVLIPCQFHFNLFIVSCSTARFYLPEQWKRLFQCCQHQVQCTGSMETSSSQIPDPGGRFMVLIPCQSHFNPFRVSCSTARFYVSTGKIPNVYLGARLYQRCQTQQISHAC